MLHKVRQEGLLEVEHVKNASRQEGEARTDVDNCVTERNTRAVELAKTWSDVGWRSSGINEGQHDSAGKRGCPASFQCLVEWDDCEELNQVETRFNRFCRQDCIHHLVLHPSHFFFFFLNFFPFFSVASSWQFSTAVFRQGVWHLQLTQFLNLLCLFPQEMQPL